MGERLLLTGTAEIVHSRRAGGTPAPPMGWELLVVCQQLLDAGEEMVKVKGDIACEGDIPIHL